ncbi:MAG TPA: PHB depolymerase family esterase, partial [Advenella sp.]|nr:PHB depolymerase family esterase [Advenella sp.]
YVAGLSAGASMAGLVVLRHPHVFAATAMHSGAVLGYARDATTGLRTMRKASPVDPVELINPLVHGTALSGRPLLILHGKRDHLVSMQNAEQLAAQFAHLNAASASRARLLAQGTHREYVRQDFLNGKKIMVRLCLLKEVGHAWSGGNSKLKFSSKEGPSASVLIWQFFCMHGR